MLFIAHIPANTRKTKLIYNFLSFFIAEKCHIFSSKFLGSVQSFSQKFTKEFRIKCILFHIDTKYLEPTITDRHVIHTTNRFAIMNLDKYDPVVDIRINPIRVPIHIIFDFAMKRAKMRIIFL